MAAQSQKRTKNQSTSKMRVDFHHGRFSLPVGKLLSAVAVYINARELLTIGVIDGDLPVLMFATLVALHTRRFGGALLFHVFQDLESCDYVNFGFARQDTISGVRFASIGDCGRNFHESEQLSAASQLERKNAKSRWNISLGSRVVEREESNAGWGALWRCGGKVTF